MLSFSAKDISSSGEETIYRSHARQSVGFPRSGERSYGCSSSAAASSDMDDHFCGTTHSAFRRSIDNDLGFARGGMLDNGAPIGARANHPSHATQPPGLIEKLNRNHHSTGRGTASPQTPKPRRYVFCGARSASCQSAYDSVTQRQSGWPPDLAASRSTPR